MVVDVGVVDGKPCDGSRYPKGYRQVADGVICGRVVVEGDGDVRSLQLDNSEENGREGGVWKRSFIAGGRGDVQSVGRLCEGRGA